MWRPLIPALVLVALIPLPGAGAVQAQDPAVQPARQAVDAWLALIDKNDYAATWQTAAGTFKKLVTQEQWADAARSARSPLGALKSRVLKSATPTTTLPGAPAGSYVVFQFETAFELNAATFETAIAALDSDGAWRVGGYFVRPR
jgi:Protein of unknown function (DUF4019)